MTEKFTYSWVVSGFTWPKECFSHRPLSTSEPHEWVTIAFILKQPLFKVPCLGSPKFTYSNREGGLSFTSPSIVPKWLLCWFWLFLFVCVGSDFVIWSHLSQSLWPSKWAAWLGCLKTFQSRDRQSLHCWNCIDRKQRKVPVSLPEDSRQDWAGEVSLCCSDAVRWVTRLTGPK